MTRVLITTQVFTPSHDAISQLLEDLVSALSEAGFDVHVLTPDKNYMTGESLLRHEEIRGARVWRVPVYRADKKNLLERSFAYASFFALSGPALGLIPKPDVVFYLSTPPMLGWSGAPAKHFLGAKTVFVAQDVYPEILARSGHLNNALAFKALSKLDRVLLSTMDKVVVLGERMRDVMVCKGVPREKIRIIENWSIATGVGSASRDANPLLERLGLSEKFVLQYSGNMGLVHDMDPIIDAAEALRGEKDTAFLMIGDGKQKRVLQNAMERTKLTNMKFLPYQPIEDLPVSLAAADVSLISLKPSMEGLVVPSKLYGILAAGRPILNIGDSDGEVARVVRRAACGITARDGEELAAAAKELRDNRDTRTEMGENAKKYFKQHFGRDRSVMKYKTLIEELTSK